MFVEFKPVLKLKINRDRGPNPPGDLSSVENADERQLPRNLGQTGVPVDHFQLPRNQTEFSINRYLFIILFTHILFLFEFFIIKKNNKGAQVDDDRPIRSTIRTQQQSETRNPLW